MVIINHKTIPVDKMADIENAIAVSEKNQADLDYVAMMCDVDIHEEDNEDE